MPLSKYHIRNEYGLADPELYRAADRDDPEALLEAVAMSGLVGLLRQLGDLAEFAAEIFHDLHEEVMATAARGHGLMTRVQQLEAEVPSLEKAFFSQTHHTPFFTNGGVDWHPNLRSEQNVVTHGDLPRFVMDSYEECRGPPRLFLLDKFDVAGAGACLKRYTDPSFFKMESASFGTTAEIHREKRIRKVKKKGARLRDGEGPNVIPTHAKLHQLLLEERIENGYTDPARLVKLKKRQLNGSAVESKSGKSYMAKFLETPSPDHKMIYETSIIPLPVKSMSDDTSESGIKTLEISSISPTKRTVVNESPNEQESELKPFSDMDVETNGDFVEVKEQISAVVTDEISSNHPKFPEETDLTVHEQKKIEGILNGYHSDDVASEVDNYMDALTTMESELETDSEFKLKNSLLNIQKATDADDKEEHQLGSRFSYSQSFGDSSTSDEISSFKHDRKEEHIEAQARLSDSHSLGTPTSDNNSSFRRDGGRHREMQAHFSDSQSVGNSSISDDNSSFKKDRSYFRHSDSSSSVAEIIQSETILFPNTKYYEQEVEEDTPSNQLAQIVEFQHTDCGKFVVHEDAHVHEDEVSDSGQASHDLMTSGHVLCCDLGPASPVVLPTGSQSDETPSNPAELNLQLEDDEYRAGLVESITTEPVSLSIVKDDAFPVDSSDKNSLDNLDDSNPYVHSEDLVHVSHNLGLAHENESSNHSEKFQGESPNKSSCEGLVGRDIGSPGEDPIPSFMEELDLNSGTTLALDSQNSKEEDCITVTQLNSEKLTPIVEIPPVSSVASNNPQDEPSSAETEVLCSGERPKMVHNDETRSSSDDPVEGDGHFKSPPDNHVMVSDVVAEDFQSEDQALLTVPSVSSDEKNVGIVTCLAADLICSPSRSLTNLQEPLSGSSTSYLIEKESNEVELPQISVDLSAEKRENQLESLLDISSFNIRCSPTSSHTKMEEALSTAEDPHEKEMEVNNAVARESLTEFEEIVYQPEIASADVQLNLKNLVASDLSDSERCNDIEISSPREKFQQSTVVDDLEMVPDFSGLDSQQSESIFDGQNDPLQNGRDEFLSRPCNQMQSETDLELSSQSQVGEVDAELLPRGEESSASEKSQSQQMQAHQLELETTHATSEFASEFHADELLSSHSFTQSGGLEVNPTKPVINPLKPFLPDLTPKATVDNLDEMPPMPPLPPMQWRMGKVQHPSLVSQREEVEISQASVQAMLPSVQPMLPIKPDRKPQFGLPTSERETLLYQSPFVPVMAVESDKLQHSSGFPVGVSGHPVAIPFQFPIMANEANSQYNYVVLDRSQIQNPFLTLPVVTTGRPLHSYTVSSEGEMTQNSNVCPPMPPSECAVSVNDSISLQEKPTQPPSQLMRDTISEVKKLEQSTSNVVSMDGTPDGHLVIYEGEMVQNSNPCPPIPPVECTVSEQDSISPQEEPNQPQLMTETTSEDITFVQSTSNVVSTGRPPHGHVAASEGEMVQSSNPCPPIPPAECAAFEDDSISPQEKLTHPSNQLIAEASSEVNTLHQSKLNAEGGQGHPSISLMLPPNMECMEPNQSFLAAEGETALSLDASAQTSDFESESINGKPKNKLPRPRNPLIDAVAAHDKSKLRRVTERIMPQIAPKVDERDSLLEQIRTKSFNLKPTVATRPSIQGPRTNLKLAAILEKANAIRQALAGSDEDDDADSWSDS